MEPILDSLAQKNEGDSGSSDSEGEGEGGEECASSGKSEKKVDANKVEAGKKASLGESLVEAFRGMSDAIVQAASMKSEQPQQPMDPCFVPLTESRPTWRSRPVSMRRFYKRCRI